MSAADENVPTEAPRVGARRGANGHGLLVVCPYCREEHPHGPALGPRAAPCGMDKAKLGYIIVAVEA